MNFPGDKDRHAIVGGTGNGKTRAALWYLSLQDYTSRPWIVYNFKGEEDIDNIPFAHQIGTDEIPTYPGIFIVKPLPHETEEVENQMWEIWHRGNMGVYVDEGYMIGANNRAYRALLTQGRSKRIPMMNLSQRPVFMDKFVFTESQFWNIFELGSEEDEKKIREYIRPPRSEGQKRGVNIIDSASLKRFHSYYYDVREKKLDIMEPVPDLPEIYDTFYRRLEKLRVKKVI